MRFLRRSALFASLALWAAAPVHASLVITEIVDGTLSGGHPRWVEITNTGNTTVTLTGNYSFGNVNNGGTVLGGGGAQPLTGSIAPGASYIVGYEVDPGAGTSNFESVYGFAPNFYMGGNFINGDDVVLLFLGNAIGGSTDTPPWGGATVVDLYGVVGVDGTGQVWDYEDGYSVRSNVPNKEKSSTFDPNDWIFGGPNSLEKPVCPGAGCSDDNLEVPLLRAKTHPGSHPFVPGATGWMLAVLALGLASVGMLVYRRTAKANA